MLFHIKIKQQVMKGITDLTAEHTINPPLQPETSESTQEKETPRPHGSKHKDKERRTSEREPRVCFYIPRTVSHEILCL